MPTIKRFEEIEAWQDSRQLVKTIYKHTRSGHFGKDFILRDQIRRASISIMANIAEGFERKGDVEFRRFLYIAKASAGEVRSLIYVAFDLGYFDTEIYESLMDKVTDLSSKIAAFIKYLDAEST